MSALHGAGRGEHHAASDVASGVDIRCCRAHVVVDNDRASFVDLNADRVQPESCRVGTLAHADDGVATAKQATILSLDGDVIVVKIDMRDARRHLDFHAA